MIKTPISRKEQLIIDFDDLKMNHNYNKMIEFLNKNSFELKNFGWNIEDLKRRIYSIIDLYTSL